MDKVDIEIIENLIKTIQNIVEILKSHEERITRLEKKKKGLFG